jgi:hypothetical protein
MDELERPVEVEYYFEQGRISSPMNTRWFIVVTEAAV